MNKNTKKLPPVLPIIAIVLFLIVGALQLYVENVSRIFSLYGKIYQYERSITDDDGYTQMGYIFAEFTDDGFLDIIATDEYFTAINKTRYDYRYRVWNNIGNLYFKTDSLLSATIFKENAIPITLEMKCVESRSWYTSWIDEDADFVTYENIDEVGTYLKSEVWFYEDSMVLDGISFPKIDDIDPVCREMIRLFIDNDDIFCEYLVE